jgi:transposase-like protein
MASIKGKRIFIIFVISPLVFIFLAFLGKVIHWVMSFIAVFALFIIVQMALRMRCPRCGVITKLIDLRYRRDPFADPLLCENCGYNFSEDVGKARKKKIVTRKG